jgi:hypothetical protein
MPVSSKYIRELVVVHRLGARTGTQFVVLVTHESVNHIVPPPLDPLVRARAQ